MTIYDGGLQVQKFNKELGMYCDEDALLLLLKAPKKKYIKKLMELGACLNVNHNCAIEGFHTPISQNFQADLQLTKQQAHRLLYAISSLIEASCKINFNFEQQPILSEGFDQQLKEMLIACLQSMQTDIQEARASSTRQGRTLVDLNWKLDLQIANEAGKSNTPSIMLQIDSYKNGELASDKIKMKGEQFLAFFGNLKKIKNQLLQLVEAQQEENPAQQ